MTGSIFESLERPMAVATFAVALVCLLWKSPLGIDWLPGIGPAWMAMFGKEDDSNRLPQYPRRSADEGYWTTVYFCMYGVFATVAQYGGLQISRRKIAKSQVVLYAKLYGLFHMVIGVHHLIWSQKHDYGKLELWRYDLPLTYEGTALSAAYMIYQGFGLLLRTKDTTPLAEICHVKTVLDTVSVCTVISCAVFTVCNLLGIATSFELERLLWGITMYSLPVVLIAGEVTRK